MKTVKTLFQGLLDELSKKQGTIPQALKSELASIATRYFADDRPFVKSVTDLIKGRISKPDALILNEGKFIREWNGDSAKMKNRGLRIKKVAVDNNTPDDTNEANDDVVEDISLLVGMNQTQILEKFGDTGKLKTYCREMAIQLDYRLGAEKFTTALINYLEETYPLLLSSSEEEEE